LEVSKQEPSERRVRVDLGKAESTARAGDKPPKK
jgi:hypothetical protein